MMEASAFPTNPADRAHRTFMLSFLLRGTRTAVLTRAVVMTAAIAVVDWRIEGNIPLGFLYLFPMLLVGSVLNRWQIAIAAGVCTVLTELFDAFEWFSPAGIPRDILIFAAFFCMGLFVFEVIRSRQAALQHTLEIERESHARSDAEEQLKVLVESSPAAVFTTDSDGAVLLANQAAHRLFMVPPGTLPGKPIHEFLPSLVNVLATRAGTRPVSGNPFRTAMQCRGRRQNGESFLADVWFSTYGTTAGPRLAAMVVDGSEDLRNREAVSLHQLLAASRILVGAVSHEIRNVCGAIAMAHANLSKTAALAPSLASNKDFEALGNLILALEKIAAMDLRQMADQASSVDLRSLLEEFRIIVEPALEEQDIRLSIEISDDMPLVWADRQSLLQVMLNLTRNSERAMQNEERRELTIAAMDDQQRVTIRFTDTGCGVAHPDRLFRPFQQQAQAAGLGLFLSRAFMRSFRGDLRYEPEPVGSSFIVELSRVMAGSKDAREVSREGNGRADPDIAHRRPQPVP
ncbi:MAG TPA: ATP-binding protein [Bryobacteraceae bacterium]|jgi:PAS domain S-box-containing protein|nr:ATP-binding protein [Bryobacteraceae bacterium]